jgi:hypothetical protein
MVEPWGYITWYFQMLQLVFPYRNFQHRIIKYRQPLTSRIAKQTSIYISNRSALSLNECAGVNRWKGKKQLKPGTVLLFVARPTYPVKLLYCTSHPQASQAAAVLWYFVRSSAPFFIWVMECKSAMKRMIPF